MGVGDGLAGKTITCPKCKGSIFVTPAAPAGGKASAPAKGSKASPGVYISTGKIVMLAVAAIVLVMGILFFIGPMRVWNQWEAMGEKASDDVNDVLTFALQAYLSEQGDYDPSKAHHTPTVEGDVTFFRPFLAMSMPEKVKFEGKSNQGDFNGYYNTTNGEIEADMAFGGYSFAGMVNISKSTGKFHLTGRKKNGQAEAEVDGKKLKIVYPEKKDED